MLIVNTTVGQVPQYGQNLSLRSLFVRVQLYICQFQLIMKIYLIWAWMPEFLVIDDSLLMSVHIESPGRQTVHLSTILVYNNQL